MEIHTPMKNHHSLLPLCLLLTVSSVRAVVPDQAKADLVLGQQMANAGNCISPYIAVDPVTQKVFVADGRWNRILRFSSTASLTNGADAEAVLGQAGFSAIDPGTGPDRLNSPLGLWCDGQGRLWVSDSGNNRVLRFNNAATLPTGSPATGVLGQVNFSNVS